MKIILLALLSPLLCFAQVDKNSKTLSAGVQDSVPGTSIILTNQNIIFQKIYDSNLKKEELNNKLNILLSMIKTFRFDKGPYQTGNEFIGRLMQYKVDAERYGGTMFGTPAVLSIPLNAIVVVQIKDFKYRVIVSEITFKEANPSAKQVTPVNISLSDYITQKKRSQIKTGKSDVKLAQFIDQDFSDRFDLQKSSIATDF